MWDDGMTLFGGWEPHNIWLTALTNDNKESKKQGKKRKQTM